MTSFLFSEVITSERNCKQIFVFRVPRNRSDMFFLFLIIESPNRKQLTLRSPLFLSFFPIISVVVVFFVLLVLTNHSLHNFHTSFKRNWITTSLLLWLLFMGTIFFFLFVIFFELFFLFFKILYVAIPNVPLSDLTS